MAVCDICSSPGMGTVISSKDLQKAVKKGFNPMSEGLITNPTAMMDKSSWYAGWKSMVNQDSSDWNICARCMAKLQPYLSGSPKATGVKKASVSQEQILEEMSKERLEGHNEEAVDEVVVEPEDDLDIPEVLENVPSTKKKNKTLWIILIIFAVLLFLCCCATVFILLNAQLFEAIV